MKQLITENGTAVPHLEALTDYMHERQDNLSYCFIQSALRADPGIPPDTASSQTPPQGRYLQGSARLCEGGRATSRASGP